MSFYLIGIDYQKADIGLREELYRRRKDIGGFWHTLGQEPAILSTCNRFEIYLCANSGLSGCLSQFYRRFIYFYDYGYYEFDETRIFRHALRLGCGLESQIKGEPQILEQIDSWRLNIPAEFSRIWQKAVLEARDIRLFAGLNLPDENLATFTYQDLTRGLFWTGKLRIVVIGTGRIAGLLAKHRPRQAYLTFATHKHRARAEDLAGYTGGSAISLQDLPEALADADALISATSSPHFILGAEEILEVMLRRKNPFYIYDLAIPRDIEPAAGELKGVVLKNLDGLEQLFHEHRQLIGQNLYLAEYLVEERAKDYEKNIQNRDASQHFSLKAD